MGRLAKNWNFYKLHHRVLNVLRMHSYTSLYNETNIFQQSNAQLEYIMEEIK